MFTCQEPHSSNGFIQQPTIIYWLPEMTDRTILCIILHYGDEYVTWECVKNIHHHNLLDILIVDNDPKQRLSITDKYIGRVNIFRTGGTAGFARANNLAVKYARKNIHDSIFLLNNDTLVLDDAIDKLYGLLNTDNIGLVGPCIPYASNPEKIWACGGIIERLKVKIYGIEAPPQSMPFDVDYLPGAAILCRMKIWDLTGGLPEKYFLAYEEADFAIQVKKLGYRVVVNPDARVLHKVGMSSNIQPMYAYNSMRNRLRFVWGRISGFILASILCFIGSAKNWNSLTLWYKAVRDEISGLPLDRDALQNIKRQYKD